MKLDQIVYATIGVGLLIVGAGIGYVINYESRISKLETQLGFVLGAQPKPTKGDEGQAEAALLETLPNTPVAEAIALQCGTLMAQSSKIVDEAVIGLTPGTRDRLAALSDLINQLGCGTLAGR